MNRRRARDDADSSVDSDDTDYSARLAEIEALQAQQEWEEGIEQLYTVMSLVLLPLLGKYLGRKFTHWCECSESAVASTLSLMIAFQHMRDTTASESARGSFWETHSRRGFRRRTGSNALMCNVANEYSNYYLGVPNFGPKPLERTPFVIF